MRFVQVTRLVMDRDDKGRPKNSDRIEEREMAVNPLCIRNIERGKDGKGTFMSDSSGQFGFKVKEPFEEVLAALSQELDSMTVMVVSAPLDQAQAEADGVASA